MDAHPLLGFLAIAGLATSAFAQGPGIQFEATNRATFIYIQGQSEYHPFLLNVTTMVHVNSAFVVSKPTGSDPEGFLGENVSLVPSVDHPGTHLITMRAYWSVDPSGASSVLPRPMQIGSSEKATVFRSNIIVGDDRGGVPLRLTAIAFTAN